MHKGQLAQSGERYRLRQRMARMPVGDAFLWAPRPAPYVVAMELGITIRTYKVEDGYVVSRVK